MMQFIAKPMSSGVKGKWPDEHKRYLLLHHDDMYIEDIAVYVGRTAKAVRAMAWAMGCSFKSKPKGDE